MSVIATAEENVWLGNIHRFEYYREIVEWAARSKAAGRMPPLSKELLRHRLDPFRQPNATAATMKSLIGTCCLTTVIAMLSVFSARHAPLQTRVLPWVGGVLLGIGAFWILPEMAAWRGWALALIGVSAILLVPALIDRYIYSMCPFCAAGAHPGAASDSIPSCRHTIAPGWPLLAAGCIHSFFELDDCIFTGGLGGLRTCSVSLPDLVTMSRFVEWQRESARDIIPGGCDRRVAG